MGSTPRDQTGQAGSPTMPQSRPDNRRVGRQAIPRTLASHAFSAASGPSPAQCPAASRSPNQQQRQPSQNHQGKPSEHQLAPAQPVAPTSAAQRTHPRTTCCRPCKPTAAHSPFQHGTAATPLRASPTRSRKTRPLTPGSPSPRRDPSRSRAHHPPEPEPATRPLSATTLRDPDDRQAPLSFRLSLGKYPRGFGGGKPPTRAGCAFFTRRGETRSCASALILRSGQPGPRQARRQGLTIP